MKAKLEVIRINNDVIATSSSECEFLEVKHFKIEGEQEFLNDDCFSGKHYSFDQNFDAIRVQYIGSFENTSGTPGWYHLNSNTGAYVWCEHQDHNDFINNYNTID